MSNPVPNISIKVDPQNPGQFFACCGLLELADRISPGAEGWFEGGEFRMHCNIALNALVKAIASAKLVQIDKEDATASPIWIGQPFNICLDWWKSEVPEASGLKVWAGTMESYRIMCAMQMSMRDERFLSRDLLNVGVVAYDPEDTTKKVEPFYFDARRGPNAHSRDVGFSPNDLHITTTAFPAVEFLCLVGLQRAFPVLTNRHMPRIYDYHLWTHATSVSLVAPTVAGFIHPSAAYRFESGFRTGQRKHKAFLSAKPIELHP
jgi:CRISPR-associated protein Csb3